MALNAHTDLIETCATIRHETHGLLKSFFDGSHWRNHSLFNENVIILRLYGDDFESANTLGCHRCIYKMGCIYYQFENLPIHLASKLTISSSPYVTTVMVLRLLDGRKFCIHFKTN
jgi:hypothetical protein